MSTIPLNQGYVSARGRESLQPGELQDASGAYYKRGDAVRIWKMPGRALFADTGSGAKIKGMALCRFDSAEDQLVVLSGTTLYKSGAGSSGSFSSAATGLSSSADRLEAAHANDRWYLANGQDTLRVLESDGSVRTAGLSAPDAAPQTTASNSAYTVERGSVASSTNFTNTANAVDSDDETASAGTADASMVVDSWSTSTGTDRVVKVKYSVGTPTAYVTVKVELSEDGTNYTTISEVTYSAAASNVTVSSTVADGTTISNVKVRITVTESTDGSTATPGGGPFREF